MPKPTRQAVCLMLCLPLLFKLSRLYMMNRIIENPWAFCVFKSPHSFLPFLSQFLQESAPALPGLPLLAFLPPLPPFLQICPQQAQDQPKAHRAARAGSAGATPTLTRTMPELKADVGAPELIHRNREFQQLRPPGAVVMIKHERVILRSRWLSGAKGDKILRKKHVR